MEEQEPDNEITNKRSFAQKLKGNVWFRMVRNKYILTIMFFLAWMMFFDNNNWVYLNKLTDEAHLKQTEKAWYKNQIKDSERKLNELSSDLKALEKFARETYYMKRSNEDVFVFFPQEEKDQ